MNLLLISWKGQINSLNILLLLMLVGCFFLKSRRKLATMIIAFAVLLFLAFSTAFVPEYLTRKKERQYKIFSMDRINTADSLNVLVLGGGYTSDQDLQPLAQLSSSSLGRLVEGIRITNAVQKSKLICAGPKISGSQSLAQVYLQSARSLGVQPSQIEVLEGAMTTFEEAELYYRKYGRSLQVALVTDAIHMDRALNMFIDKGINVIPAPTNHFIKSNDSDVEMKFLPSLRNLEMTDRLIHEFLGNVKKQLID